MALKKKKDHEVFFERWLRTQRRNALFEVKTKNIRVTKQICIIKPKSPLTEGGTEVFLFNDVKGLIKQGYKYFVLNLETSDLIGSSVGTPVNIFGLLDRIGGTIKLCCLSDRTLRKLEICKLDTIFQIFKTQEEAIDSFR